MKSDLKKYQDEDSNDELGTNLLPFISFSRLGYLQINQELGYLVPPHPTLAILINHANSSPQRKKQEEKIRDISF